MTEPAEDLQAFHAALVEANEAAWRQLYRLHTPPLYRLARHLADSASDADDLIHEMWLRAARGASRFAGRSRIRTWLTGILLNCIREWRRASARRAEVDLEDDQAFAPDDPPAGLDRVDLERALAAVAPGYREVLLLHDVEGYTHQEIAGLLGIEVGTSKSQLTRARRAVVRALAPKEGSHHVR